MNFRVFHESLPGMILGFLPVHERRLYFVTTSLISWVQANNQTDSRFVPSQCETVLLLTSSLIGWVEA